jgi:hypothetical protein
VYVKAGRLYCELAAVRFLVFFLPLAFAAVFLAAFFFVAINTFTRWIVHDELILSSLKERHDSIHR